MGVTRGSRGLTIPRAPNHCRGRRKFPTMSQVLSSMQYICFRKTSGSSMGALGQTCFLPRLPSNLVAPLMQICGNTSLSLRFSSDFLVSAECKAVFAVASFRNSSAQLFKPAWCSNCSKLSDSLVNI